MPKNYAYRETELYFDEPDDGIDPYDEYINSLIESFKEEDELTRYKLELLEKMRMEGDPALNMKTKQLYEFLDFLVNRN